MADIDGFAHLVTLVLPMGKESVNLVRKASGAAPLDDRSEGEQYRSAALSLLVSLLFLLPVTATKCHWETLIIRGQTEDTLPCTGTFPLPCLFLCLHWLPSTDCLIAVKMLFDNKFLGNCLKLLLNSITVLVLLTGLSSISKFLTPQGPSFLVTSELSAYQSMHYDMQNTKYRTQYISLQKIKHSSW